MASGDRLTLENTLVAVVESRDHASDSASRLSAAGFAPEVLSGTEGKERIHPSDEGGFVASMKKMVDLFGDQHRILEELEKSVEEGNFVVIVDTEGRDPAEAARILKENRGRYLWHFDDWTHTRVATEGESGEEEEA